jgi:hypothetical protein
MFSWIFSAISLKQQSADRPVAPLGHIILIPSQPVFSRNLVLYASINVVLYALIVICFCIATFILNRIDGVIDGVLASSVVDPGIESLSGQTKDYEISICCFSCKHAALRRKVFLYFTLQFFEFYSQVFWRFFPRYMYHGVY